MSVRGGDVAIGGAVVVLGLAGAWLVRELFGGAETDELIATERWRQTNANQLHWRGEMLRASARVTSRDRLAQLLAAQAQSDAALDRLYAQSVEVVRRRSIGAEDIP